MERYNIHTWFSTNLGCVSSDMWRLKTSTKGCNDVFKIRHPIPLGTNELECPRILFHEITLVCNEILTASFFLADLKCIQNVVYGKVNFSPSMQKYWMIFPVSWFDNLFHTKLSSLYHVHLLIIWCHCCSTSITRFVDCNHWYRNRFILLSNVCLHQWNLYQIMSKVHPVCKLIFLFFGDKQDMHSLYRYALVVNEPCNIPRCCVQIQEARISQITFPFHFFDCVFVEVIQVCSDIFVDVRHYVLLKLVAFQQNVHFVYIRSILQPHHNMQVQWTTTLCLNHSKICINFTQHTHMTSHSIFSHFNTENGLQHCIYDEIEKLRCCIWILCNITHTLVCIRSYKWGKFNHVDFIASKNLCNRIMYIGWIDCHPHRRRIQIQCCSPHLSPIQGSQIVRSHDMTTCGENMFLK